MSSGPLTIICLPDLQLLQSPSPAEIEAELNKAFIAAGLNGLSQLKLELERVVVSWYPLSLQVASLFLPVSQVMTDPVALSSAPIPASTKEDVEQWILSTESTEKWFELPEHQPLDYAAASLETQGVVAVVPLSFYQRYAGSALTHTLVEYGKGSVSKPVFDTTQAKRAVSPALPPKQAVFVPSRHDLDVQMARVEVAVVQEIHSLAVPQHSQRSQALKTSIETTVSKALACHYADVSELKTPKVPYNDENTKEMASALTDTIERIIELHVRAKNLEKKLNDRGYR